MRFDSLRQFIEVSEGLGELKRVDNADWNCEIGAITELMAERKGPVLLFDRIKDYPAGHRVLTNLFSTLKRSALVLGLSEDLNGLDMLKQWKVRLSEFKPVPPLEVKKAPIKENILLGKDVDLFKLPTPKWHELDGGRYLGTASCVITRDPDEGWVNVGTYRCMIQESNKLTVKLNLGKHGRTMLEKFRARGGGGFPLAIAFGQDPALFAAACDMAVPWGVSEYDFAGWLRGAPVEVVRGEVTDLPIPATAEVVIEGEIPPGPFEQRVEGPFGEATGYSADQTTGVLPVMTVKSILHRDAPILHGAPPMKPPLITDFAIPRWAVAVWDALEKAGIKGVKGVWFTSSTVMPHAIVISIKLEYPGQAMQTGMAAATSYAGSYGGRVVIVVEDDIDITNTDEVMWAVSTRCRVERDIQIIRDTWTCGGDPPLDPAARAIGLNTSSKVIINACRPWERVFVTRDYPTVNTLSPQYRNRVLEKWAQLFA